MDIIDFIVTAAFGAVFRELIQFAVESVRRFRAEWKGQESDVEER